ncbi:12-(S)-hydroxy-5,8,10,14-eicosatetraenoic acid receptor [Gracilinanus agilis]|uniref:12-(S)-hydroxy-5,8,10,14-eicosatetraenoic acid receptor n=1 Tax=Gracilinanus agilis TaxID=191870 RepID=UPI001CFE8F0A|nr:12-(S)-hydroxy-5,8,10,14-eicosatetraenoic acid receptor [Gracilinanus agilis]
MTPIHCSFQNSLVEISIVSLLILEFAVGLLGNAIALWTFISHLKVWKPYAVYLFNLVIADLLLSVCLPFQISFYLMHKKWELGPAACRTLIFLLSLSRTSGIAFLTAVAMDRYLRVVHPHFKINSFSTKAAKIISAFIWLLVVGLVHPSLWAPKIEKNATECPSFSPMEDLTLGNIWQEAVICLQFLLPFSLILFCNIRIIKRLQQRLLDQDKQPKLQRSMALVTVVVVFFGICFLPNFLARTLMAIFQTSENCQVLQVMVHTCDITNSLTYLNSVLNPVVYCFSNPVFRYSYRKVFSTLRGRQRELQPQGLDGKDSCHTVESPGLHVKRTRV